ncbi:GNAT family N-acetyltransferase [Paenibacillus bouchesdurhonensis]|uniref:GNAT family N-acetyltransferase n=1 Tax=Paenibacillus bouchesdurhonensis TaxID=1870990 RepID=UPI000DA60BEB|nr:GNAT family N-acetyltransferase [Paenibacillus bouchesdurhonensis]
MSSMVLAPALVIRRSCSGDVEQMLPLMRQLKYPTTPSVLHERLCLLEEHPLLCSYVAELDGKLIGTTFLKQHQTHDMSHPVTLITAMVVDEKHRSTGVGRQLVEAAEAWAQEQGSNQLVLSAGGERNMLAKSFYEHMGFICRGYRLSKSLDS